MTEVAVAPRPTATAIPESPYKGLLPYLESDTAFFFGRERERGVIAANLMAARLTLLYGPSGVGKTSVLLAGVASDVNEHAREALEDEDTPGLALVVFKTWPGDCVVGLEAAVAESVRAARHDRELEDPPVGARLDEVLAHWTRELEGRLLIVLDQFEEFFLYGSSGGRFEREFPECVNRPDLRANILVSIREDALAKLDRFKGHIPSLFDNCLRIDRLDLTSARNAIEEPLRQWAKLTGEHVEIESELVERVLDQARPDLSFGQRGAGTPDKTRPDRIETTFLQLVMTQLWKKERAEGSSTLRASTFESVGRVRGIVRTHVDDALGRLTDPEPAAAAEVLRFLVTRSGQKVALTASDLVGFTGLGLEPVTAVLERLSARDLSILRRVEPLGGAGGEPLYEIYHDTLGEPILDWRARYLEKRQRLEAEENAQAIVDAAAKRRRKRALIATAVTGGAALVSALVWFGVIADARATKEREISRSRALAASAIAILPSDPEASVASAAAAERQHDTPEAEEALRRSLEASRLRAVLPTQADLVRSGFVGNGAYLAAAGKDGTLTIWDTATHKRWLTIRGDKGWFPGLAARGNVVVVERGAVYRIWNVPRRKQISHFFYPSDRALLPVLSPNGRELATTDVNQLRLLRLGIPHQRPVKIAAGRKWIDAVALTASGDRVATATRDTGTRVWDIASPSHFVQMRDRRFRQTFQIVFSADGRVLLTVDADGAARAWNSRTGQLLATLRGADPVTDVAFSPDNRLAATVAAETVTVWDARTWRALAIRHHPDFVQSVAFSPDSEYVLTATRAATAWIWGARTGQTLLTLPHSNSVTDAHFSPDGRYVVSAIGKDLHVWDVSAGAALPRVGTGEYVSAAFSGDGSMIATGGDDGAVRIWNARTRKQIAQVVSHKGVVAGVEFDRAGHRVVSAGWDHTAVVWNWRTHHRVVLRGHRRDVITANFARDGRVVTASLDKTAIVWDSRTGKELHRLRGHTDFVSNAAFSPDGTLVATASWDHTVGISSARTGKLLRTLYGHRAGVNAVAFSPDGRLLISAGLDKTAILWDTRTWKKRRVLLGHTQPVWAAAFSADGKLVVTGASDATARVWDVATGRALGVLQRGTSSINSAAFDPRDRLRILTTTDDGSVVVGPCETCAPIDRLLKLARERERVLGS